MKTVRIKSYRFRRSFTTWIMSKSVVHTTLYIMLLPTITIPINFEKIN